jgi:hypothetical protein
VEVVVDSAEMERSDGLVVSLDWSIRYILVEKVLRFEVQDGSILESKGHSSKVLGNSETHLANERLPYLSDKDLLFGFW